VGGAVGGQIASERTGACLSARARFVPWRVTRVETRVETIEVANDQKSSESHAELPKDEYGRISFSKIPDVMEVPNLLAVQLESLRALSSRPPRTRRSGKNQGPRIPIPVRFSHRNRRRASTVSSTTVIVGESKYTGGGMQERDLTFAAPAQGASSSGDKRRGPDTKRRRSRIIIQSEVFLGEIPLLTDKGTFIINGAEGSSVSQLHRSPAWFFGDEIHPNGTLSSEDHTVPRVVGRIHIDINDGDVRQHRPGRKDPRDDSSQGDGFSTRTRRSSDSSSGGERQDFASVRARREEIVAASWYRMSRTRRPES